MSEQFKVGEIAILQNLPPQAARYSGTECQILLEEREYQMPSPIPGIRMITIAYTIRDCDGNVRLCDRSRLRKKKPPQEDDANKVVSWDECAWKPPVKEPA